jgi:hypothetical protein
MQMKVTRGLTLQFSTNIYCVGRVYPAFLLIQRTPIESFVLESIGPLPTSEHSVYRPPDIWRYDPNPLKFPFVGFASVWSPPPAQSLSSSPKESRAMRLKTQQKKVASACNWSQKLSVLTDLPGGPKLNMRRCLGGAWGTVFGPRQLPRCMAEDSK